MVVVVGVGKTNLRRPLWFQHRAQARLDILFVQQINHAFLIHHLSGNPLPVDVAQRGS